MKNIIRASIILSCATLVSLVVAVIKRKLLAVHLGPAGLGIYAQVYNYFTVAVVIASFGLYQGITTYVARNHSADAADIRNRVLKTGVSILLALSLVAVLITFLFSRGISALVINDRSVHYLLIIVAIGIPFQLLAQALLSYLQGIKLVKKISLANIGTSILGLLFAVPLIIYLGALGAVLSILVLAVITFFVFVYTCREMPQIKKFWRLLSFREIVQSPYAGKLVNFGSLRFVQTGLSWLAFFAMRVIIMRKLGAVSNGMYEAVYTFSLLFLPLISSILWSYSYPEYCQAANNNDLSEAVNRFLKLSIMIAFPVMIFLILSRSFLIEKVVFTSQFSPAVGLLPMRLIVDLFIVISWSLNVVLLAKNRLKVAVAFEVVKDVVLLSLVAILASTYKLKGILFADLVGYLSVAVLSYIYIKKHFTFKFLDESLFLTASAIGIVCLIGFLPVNNIISIVVGIAISVVWIIRFVSFTEIKQAVMNLRDREVLPKNKPVT